MNPHLTDKVLTVDDFWERERKSQFCSRVWLLIGSSGPYSFIHGQPKLDPVSHFLKKGCKVGRALDWVEDLGRISRRSGGLKIIKIQCMQIHEFSNNKI